MKRLMAVALAPALLLIACGSTGGGEVAATVGDGEVTVSDVQSFPYESSGSMPPGEFAQYLTALIQWRILDAAAAEEFSIDPTEEEVDEELQSVLETQGGGMSLEEVAESQNLAEDTMRRIVRVGLVQELVAAELGAEASEPTSEEVAEALDAEEAGLTEVCVRHILVESAEEAGEARDRLEGGESFEDVAADVSTDPSAADNGGDLGCAPARQYVPEFRDAAVEAEIDAVTEPVESQFGFHILQVYDRTGPSAEELPTEEEVRESLMESAGMTELEEWMLEKLDEAEVSVNEEYGEWVTDPQPMVQPPAGEAPASTLPGG
ncbi:MAG: peptidylprolyl isomerase [Actinomycetota bacterium]